MTALSESPHSSPPEVMPSEDDDTSLPSLPQPSTASEEKDSKNKKRKRTSPEDHNTLEQEYRRNPKPDKAARMEIVEKVKLTEKEVQIWFQNKRQSSRRKSRPLLPHEIAAFGLGGMAALSSDPISSSLYGSSQPMSPGEHSRSDISAVEPGDDNQEKGWREPEKEKEKQQRVFKVEDDSVPPVEIQRTSSQPEPLNDITVSAQTKEQESIVVDEISKPQPAVQLTQNDLNSSIRRASSSGAPTDHTSPFTPQLETRSVEEINSVETTAPSSSRMRLSLSLDGRAELEEVSPPRAHAPRPSLFDLGAVTRRAPGLQRSQSALPLGCSNRLLASSRAPRLTTGRSRDARAWEFYADNGIRKELSLPVEHQHHDPSGSAVAAISLIRSSSNSALKPNQNKRNAAPVKSWDGKATKKPKLSRASSSLARLQGSHAIDPVKPRKNKQPPNFAGSPTGDSDKENWISGENGSDIRRTTNTSGQAPKQDKRRVLEPTANMPPFAPKMGARRNKKRKSDEKVTSVFEDEVAEENVDPEVEKFMRGEISPSKRGDLDCVQGLLSLSQGNWR